MTFSKGRYRHLGMVLSVVMLFVIGYVLILRGDSYTNQYQDEWLMQHMEEQLKHGPRVPGSEAHEKTKEYIVSMLTTFEWDVIEQDWLIGEIEFTNIIAYDAACDVDEKILVGAHYDSRIYADHDPVIENRDQAVMGANDGASGVAVLLDLARILDDEAKCGTTLLFIDAEDNGGIADYEWIMGSRHFVEEIATMPFEVTKAVIVDMIGDAELNVHYERNSDDAMQVEIWEVAENLGYNKNFIQAFKYSMLDDHIPFVEAGIPAVDIIDFDYVYWHTTEDTLDKVSIESLKIIIDVVSVWIEGQF